MSSWAIRLSGTQYPVKRNGCGFLGRYRPAWAIQLDQAVSDALPIGPWINHRIPDRGHVPFDTVAKGAKKLGLAACSHSSNFAAVLDRIMDWKSPMVVRATTSSGTFTSIAATRIASAFARSSRAVVKSLAITLVDFCHDLHPIYCQTVRRDARALKSMLHLLILLRTNANLGHNSSKCESEPLPGGNQR